MGELHPLAAFGVSDRPWPDAPPSYWYEGRCPHTQAPLRLPRTAQAEAIAQGLMAHLAADPHHPQEGKMYGVLLVTTPTGTPAVLQAFSGLLGGQSQRAGWVPPLPGRSQVALLERQTLQQLATLKADLLTLAQLPERATLAQQSQCFAEQLAALATRHRARKQERDRQRAVYAATLHGEALDLALAALIRQSQQDGTERRQLKRARDRALEPLRAAIAQADQHIATLKHQRQALSKQLQTQLHAAYALTNFAGQTASLETLWPTGLPTGTGDCAAPKLLHYAATHGLTPVALAEFWWGPASRERQPGAFYGACAERCQPIMGFLLSGLAAARPLVDLDQPLPIWYEDEALLVVNKPPGLLSVPGRTRDLQDSVLSRLRCQWPPEAYLAAPHRLDKGTSGLLLLAKTPAV
ncbi:MAG TPA: pseudouridine synthase, partial [Candidatus Obscuribacterales bacterium]